MFLYYWMGKEAYNTGDINCYSLNIEPFKVSLIKKEDGYKNSMRT